jgi:hypothetical protein
MTSVPNVIAEGVNTVEWLSSPDTVLAVPAYQRQYWDVEKCARSSSMVRVCIDDLQQGSDVATLLAPR